MQIDNASIPEGVVLRPTVKEFSNFRQYVNTLESRPELKNQGIVKVILTRSCPQPPLCLMLETSGRKYASLT